MFKEIGTYSDTEIKTFTAEIKREIQNGAITSAWEAYISALSKPLEKAFYDMDKSTETFVNDLELRFNEKKLMFGIQFPEDEIDRITEIFNAKMDNANFKAAEVRERIDLIYEALAEQFNASTEQELAAALPGFKKLLEEEQNYCDEVTRLNNEMVQKISDIQVKAYENAENVDKNYYSNRLKSTELWYNQEEALIEKRQQWYMGENEIEALNRQEEYENEHFNTTIEMYQNLRDRYYEMSTDMTLTAEERENAQREAAKVTGQIIEEEMNHQTQLLKIQKDNIKAWQNAVKNAAKGIGDILGTIGDAWSSLIELEKTEIAQQLENGEINEEEAKRREEANKKSFENLKKIQIAEAIINALASAVGAYQSMASIPYVGPVLGAVAAAAALASGYAQVRQIQATNYESSSTGGGSSSSSTNFQLPNVMELEPELRQNLTGMDDVDNLNNDGSGRGKGGDTVVKAYVVESDINAAQKVSSKRNQEVTF